VKGCDDGSPRRRPVIDMFNFVANLKPYTFNRPPGLSRHDAYLLSIDYDDEHAELAKKVRDEGKILVADNGNVDAIRKLQSQFVARAQALGKRRETEEKDRLAGKYARRDDLSAELRTAFQTLGLDLRRASEAITDEAYVRKAVTAQAGLEPSSFIGMEDFTIASLTALSVEPEYTGFDLGFYADLNARAIRFGVRKEVVGIRRQAFDREDSPRSQLALVDVHSASGSPP